MNPHWFTLCTRRIWAPPIASSARCPALPIKFGFHRFIVCPLIRALSTLNRQEMHIRRIKTRKARENLIIVFLWDWRAAHLQGRQQCRLAT
jgi:hypothetical protein